VSQAVKLPRVKTRIGEQHLPATDRRRIALERGREICLNAAKKLLDRGHATPPDRTLRGEC
jgi:hypothetical protein